MKKSSQVRLRNLTLLLVSTLTIMASAIIAPALPKMGMHFSDASHGELLVKMTLTVPALMIVVCAPLAGVLLDRLPKVRVLLGGLLLYGISGSCAYFISDDLLIILASRVVLGIAVAIVMVGCTTLVGDYFEGEERHQYMGYMAAFGSFGGVVFLVLGGLLAEMDWRSPFLIYSVALLMAPAAFSLLTEPEKPCTDAPLGPLSATASMSSSRAIIVLCYGFALVEITCFYIIPVHLPFYLASFSESAYTSSISGAVIGASMLMSALVALNYSRIKSKLSFPAVGMLGLLMLGSGLVLASLSGTVFQVGMSLLLSGMGVGMIRPNIVNWLLSSIAPQHRGRVMGGMTSCLFLGQFISPLLTQPLLDSYGYVTLFQIMAAVVLVCTAGLAGLFASPYATRFKLVMAPS